MNNTPRELALSTSKPSAAGNLRVSPVTLFELTALHTLGRLRLTRAPDAWMREALDAGGIRIAELSRQTAIGAGMIPRTALSDPLDRLLVAPPSNSMRRFSRATPVFATSRRPQVTCGCRTRAVEDGRVRNVAESTIQRISRSMRPTMVETATT